MVGEQKLKIKQNNLKNTVFYKKVVLSNGIIK